MSEFSESRSLGRSRTTVSITLDLFILTTPRPLYQIVKKEDEVLLNYPTVTDQPYRTTPRCGYQHMAPLGSVLHLDSTSSSPLPVSGQRGDHRASRLGSATPSGRHTASFLGGNHVASSGRGDSQLDNRHCPHSTRLSRHMVQSPVTRSVILPAAALYHN
jgi:hypothetical protein